MATTYNNLYMDIRQTLRRAGIEAATLEARELMCFASGKTRSQLVQDGQLYVPPAIEERAKDLVRRHLAGEPVAYLIGEWEFYGLPLDISESVLIPRPDTETLVDHVVAWLRPLPECRVLDLCAGSGCIGLAIASQVPGARVVLGELTAEQACHNIGTAAVAMIKKYMRTVQPAKGSITLASAPGKTTPLVQTGRLRDSITYEVTGL